MRLLIAGILSLIIYLLSCSYEKEEREIVEAEKEYDLFSGENNETDLIFPYLYASESRTWLWKIN